MLMLIDFVCFKSESSGVGVQSWRATLFQHPRRTILAHFAVASQMYVAEVEVQFSHRYSSNTIFVVQ